MIPNKIAKFIDEKILEIASGDSRFSSESKRIAQEKNALLLYLDMSGAYCLNKDGQIFSVSWDNFNEVKYEQDRRISNLVLFQGSKNFPELALLVPAKTEFDEICSHCEGTGIPKIAQETGIDSLVCYCGGLGWIPKHKSD